MSLLDRLKLPETSQITDLNSPETLQLHHRIIQQKPFLKKLYQDFYESFRPIITQNPNGTFLEIGSGAGFIKDSFPKIITSDIVLINYLDISCSALNFPFKNNSLDGIIMIDTLHHLPDTEKFFYEAIRCLKPNGIIAMIEPANTFFSRFIYQNFHHENFDPSAIHWEFKGCGPLSDANGALPWIIFKRDVKLFMKKFPNLQIAAYQNHTPLRYLLSGGFTLKQLAPSWLYSTIKTIEWLLTPFNSHLGLFSTIILQKIKE